MELGREDEFGADDVRRTGGGVFNESEGGGEASENGGGQEVSQVDAPTVSNTSMGSETRAGNDAKKENNRNSVDKSFQETKLPQTFVVKYLGKRDATGLWGIKHTRKPVDDMVAAAKTMKPGQSLPFLSLIVSEKGVEVKEMPQNVNKNFTSGLFNIEVISYGVQDLVYTRVFAMIVVQEGNIKDVHPFECHAFVCDSRQNARRLTFSLASGFQEFSKRVSNVKKKPKKFAIDLRSPEEIEAELTGLEAGDETEA